MNTVNLKFFVDHLNKLIKDAYELREKGEIHEYECVDWRIHGMLSTLYMFDIIESETLDSVYEKVRKGEKVKISDFQ